MQPRTLPECEPEQKPQPKSEHQPKRGHETKQECQLPHYEHTNKERHNASASDACQQLGVLKKCTTAHYQCGNIEDLISATHSLDIQGGSITNLSSRT